MTPLAVEKPKSNAGRWSSPDLWRHRDGMDRYVALGPLLSDGGSRAFLGLRIVGSGASPCALVWVPDAIAREPQKLERLRWETKRASALEHQNILHVFGLVELEEGLARAVEYADGESLRRVLKAAVRLPAPIAARIVIDAALGVQYAHLAGSDEGASLVHSELRPETVFVCYSGATKVAGYGAHALALRADNSEEAGEQRHRAPEQILGDLSAVNERTDIYLLGALLYETLTGETPFQGERDVDRAVSSKVPALLHSAFVPDAMRAVISKAMAKNCDRRYATALAFREGLEQAADAVAAPSAVADFIEGIFADDDHRVVRKREIDQGIQEWNAEASLLRRPLPPPLHRAPLGPRAQSPRPAAMARPVKRVSKAPEPKLASVSKPEKRLHSPIERERAPERKYSLWYAAIPIVVLLVGAGFWGRHYWTHRLNEPKVEEPRAVQASAPMNAPEAPAVPAATAVSEAPAVPAAKVEASASAISPAPAISPPSPSTEPAAPEAHRAVRDHGDRHGSDHHHRRGHGAAHERGGGGRVPKAQPLSAETGH